MASIPMTDARPVMVRGKLMKLITEITKRVGIIKSTR